MGKKILLIEDDSFMREMITLVLESENYEVSGVESGAEALQLLHDRGDFTVIISDMYLPDTNGIEIFGQVCTVYPELLFMILTSETNETIVQKATNLGIVYILKDEVFAESILAALKE